MDWIHFGQFNTKVTEGKLVDVIQTHLLVCFNSQCTKSSAILNISAMVKDAVLPSTLSMWKIYNLVDIWSFDTI